MAKNKSRKNKPQSQAKPKESEAVKEKEKEEEAAAKAPAEETVKEAEAAKQAAEDVESAAPEAADEEAAEKKPAGKKRGPLYQVKTKRDSGVILAYITFTYRVLHPKVSSRLIIYGLLLVLPGLFFFKDHYWKAYFIGIGAVLILLGFFRQYISLAMTKKNDPDYKSGAEFTYNFYDVSADFLKDGKSFLKLDKYKDITNFYYDDDYYYLAVRSRDFFVIPKKAFTIGDPAEFEEFIYKKSKHTCRWIPRKFSDKMKKRRAQRAVASKDLKK